MTQKQPIQVIALIALLSVLNPQPWAFSQGTTFTYQGRLNDGANPANGSYDLKFSLCDAVVNGNSMGIVTNTATGTSNGLFTVMLDFGANFPGAARWLEIGVRTNGSVAAYSTLAPRQPLTPTPYAIMAGNVNGLSVQLNTNGSPNVIGGSTLNYVSPGTLGAFIGGGGAANYNGSVHSNSVGAAFGAIGGGYDNIIQSGVNSVVAGGHANSVLGNASGGTVGGGDFNQIGSGAFNSTIAGGYNSSIAPTAFYSAIGGGIVNYAAGPMTTIAGGEHNSALGTHAFVGGGAYNTANGFDSIGGGRNNVVGADYSGVFCGDGNSIGETPGTGLWSFIGGGQANSIYTGADHATIGGGGGNTLQTNTSFSTISGGATNIIRTSAMYSTIGGGLGNTIGNLSPTNSTIHATIPGGYGNTAIGSFSFAAGQEAQAFHDGSFVWADASAFVPFSSTSANQFLIRASGGVGIGTASPGGTLSLFNSSSDLIFKLEDRRADTSFTRFLSKEAFYDYGGEAAFIGLQHNFGEGPAPRAMVFGLSDDGNPASEKMRITVHGDVGISTASPRATLEVAGSQIISTDGARLRLQRTTGPNYIDYNNNQALNFRSIALDDSSANIAMTIAASGNVGIGLVNPAWPLDVQASQAVGRFISTASGVAATIELKNNQPSCPYLGSINFNDALNSFQGQIAYATDSGFQLRVLGQVRMWVNASGTGIGRNPTANTLEVEGNASKTAAGSWLANSDERIKTNIVTLTNALDKLAQVRLASFRYTDEYRKRHSSIQDREYLNVIAQEFQKLFPDYVKGSGEKLADGSEILQVDTYPLTIYSAAAIQELRTEKDREIQELKQQNNAFAERLSVLEAIVKALTEKH